MYFCTIKIDKNKYKFKKCMVLLLTNNELVLLVFLKTITGNVDTQTAEDYFNWMGEELTRSFSDFVGPRKRKYLPDVSSDSESDDNHKNSGRTLVTGTPEDHSMCRVFILGFLLQFLLLKTPSKQKQPKPSSAPTTTKNQELPDSLQNNENDTDLVQLQSSTHNLHTPTNLESTSTIGPIVEGSHSVKVSAPSKKATTNISNFFILQEAARMELTRTLELVTKGITVCDTSLISLSNTDNFMHLVAQQRGVHDLQSASFFNIPLRHTFLDYVRYEGRTDIRVPGRYPWDKDVSIAGENPFTSFARLVFEQKSDKGQQERVPSWEGNVTLIQALLQDVTGHARRLHDHLSELRVTHDHAYFMRVREKNETYGEVNNSDTYTLYNNIYNNYKLTIGEHELLQRTYDNTEDDDMDFSEMSAANFIGFESTDTSSYLNQCENKVKKLVDLPYSYNILQHFLFQDMKKFNDCDIQSMAGKLSELGNLVSSFKKLLVRIAISLFNLNNYITRSYKTNNYTTSLCLLY
jgi:hypothetical protein